MLGSVILKVKELKITKYLYPKRNFITFLNTFPTFAVEEK
jgi:hypothetical protein